MSCEIERDCRLAAETGAVRFEHVGQHWAAPILHACVADCGLVRGDESLRNQRGVTPSGQNHCKNCQTPIHATASELECGELLADRPAPNAVELAVHCAFAFSEGPAAIYSFIILLFIQCSLLVVFQTITLLCLRLTLGDTLGHSDWEFTGPQQPHITTPGIPHTILSAHIPPASFCSIVLKLTSFKLTAVRASFCFLAFV